MLGIFLDQILNNSASQNDTPVPNPIVTACTVDSSGVAQWSDWVPFYVGNTDHTLYYYHVVVSLVDNDAGHSSTSSWVEFTTSTAYGAASYSAMPGIQLPGSIYVGPYDNYHPNQYARRVYVRTKTDDYFPNGTVSDLDILVYYNSASVG